MAVIKESKGARPAMAAFFVIGVLLLCAAVGLGVYFAADSANKAEVQAVITRIEPYTDDDGERQYDVYVDFEHGGEKYEHVRINFWQTGMRVGDIVTLEINASDPTGMGIPKFAKTAIPCVLALFGAVFALAGGVQLFKDLKKRRRALQAKANGRAVPCVVTAVYPDTSMSVNGRFPNNLLECVPADKSMVAVYVSAPFAAHYPVQIASGITVFIGREDPGEYYVDLASLTPPEEGEAPPNGTREVPGAVFSDERVTYE